MFNFRLYGNLGRGNDECFSVLQLDSHYRVVSRRKTFFVASTMLMDVKEICLSLEIFEFLV